MTRIELDALARRWMTFWQGADLADFVAVHAPDFVDHAPAGRASTREAFRDSVAALYAAFPRFDAHIEDLVIDEVASKVVVRWSAEAVQTNPFMGFAATRRPVRFHGVELLHCRDGLVVARWGEWDGESLAAQMAPG